MNFHSLNQHINIITYLIIRICIYFNGTRPVAIPSVAFPCRANRLYAAVVFYTAVNVFYTIVDL